MTSDLDEYAIAALAAAPVDGYGVGTQLVTGSGHPTCGFVYKLVAREDAAGELVSVAKKSQDKASIGGRKFALRRRDADGVAAGRGGRRRRAGRGRRRRPPAAGASWCAAARWSAASRLEQARARHRAARAELPRDAQQMSRGEPVIPTLHV